MISSPIDELALLARLHSLNRLRFTLDELRRHALRSAKLGIGDPFSRAMASDGTGGRIMIVEDCPSSAAFIADTLQRFHDIERVHDQDKVLDSAALGKYDLFIVSLDLTGYDGLRFCTRLRSMERTRQIPVLAIAGPKDRQRVLRGFELGVNDYVLRPIDQSELVACARKSGVSAMPTICGRMSRRHSKWRRSIP
jgi:two-component system cell cycle response regulator